MLTAHAALGACLWAAPAPEPVPSSAGQAVRITRDGESGCVTEPGLRAAIDRFLMRTDFGDALEDVRVVLTVHATARPPRVELQVETPEGRSARTLEESNCGRLTDAVGLVVAVALDPLIEAAVEPAVVPEHAPEPLPLPLPPPPPKPEPVPPSVPPGETNPPPQPAPTLTRKPRAVRHLRAGVRAHAIAEAGTLPKVAGGIGVATGLWWTRARVEVVGSYLFPRTHTPYPQVPGVGAELSLWSGGVRGCYVPRVRRLEAPLCGGIEFGAMRGEGVGLSTARVDTRLWSAAHLGFGLAWVPRSWFAVSLRADGMVTLVRPGFEVSDLGPLFRAPSAAVRLELGPEFRFP